MAYELGWGAQPDEWDEDDWYDSEGHYHVASELGGQIQAQPVEELDEEDIPF